MNRDTMDTIVKMNLSIKARQTCEQALQEMAQIHSTKIEELNSFESRFKKQDEDLIRLRDLNDEYKKKLLENDHKMLSMNTIHEQELNMHEVKLEQAHEM